MPKRGQNREPPLLDAQDNSSIIASLNKKIKDLEEEVNRLKVK
jgi:hypothetical protein